MKFVEICLHIISSHISNLSAVQFKLSHRYDAVLQACVSFDITNMLLLLRKFTRSHFGFEPIEFLEFLAILILNSVAFCEKILYCPNKIFSKLHRSLSVSLKFVTFCFIQFVYHLHFLFSAFLLLYFFFPFSISIFSFLFSRFLFFSPIPLPEWCPNQDMPPSSDIRLFLANRTVFFLWKGFFSNLFHASFLRVNSLDFKHFSLASESTILVFH